MLRLSSLSSRPALSQLLLPSSSISSSSGSSIKFKRGTRNRQRRVKVNPQTEAKFAFGRHIKLDRTEMKSRLADTHHPQSIFRSDDERLEEETRARSLSDLPQGFEEDPYQKGRSQLCVLCPRRYVEPIVLDYKNPKLLAQFVSPNTGLVYPKHITGLCQRKQEQLEVQVKRAQAFGFLATKTKELQYLNDPPLFDPSNPTRPNPL